MEFTVELQHVDGATIVTAAGELDIHTSPQLLAAADAPSRAAGVRLVVDLTRVTFIDSMGVSALIVLLKHTREADGALDLVVTEPRVLKVLALTGLDVVIPTHATLAEAHAAS